MKRTAMILLTVLSGCATTAHTQMPTSESCPNGYTTHTNDGKVDSCVPPTGSGNICYLHSDNERGLLEWGSVPDAQGNEYNASIVCPFQLQSPLHTLPANFLAEYNLPAQGPEAAESFTCEYYPPSSFALLDCTGTIGGYRVTYAIISDLDPKNFKKVSDELTIEVGDGKKVVYFDRWNGDDARTPEHGEQRASALYILDVVDDHERSYRFKHDRPGTPRDTAIFVSMRDLILLKAPIWAWQTL